MKNKNLHGVILLLCISASLLIVPASAADSLQPSDFSQESWSKTLDFFDYSRAYASANGKTPPPNDWHAFMYLAYINTTGLQLLYGGLSNITLGQASLTIPIQTVMEHYKTKDKGKDVIVASSFIMLMAFNETASNTKYQDSPDAEDNLYTSFSLGRDLSQYFEGSTPPALNSKATVIPLTSSADKLRWHWGMKYTNLTAIWWRMFINPNNPHYDAIPVAITVCDELTFTYDLTLDPVENKATLTANYVIGKMTDLWLITWFFLLPIFLHYNSTGCYRPNHTKILDETIYQFLQNQKIKMSIIMFQSSVLLDHKANSFANGKNVTDTDLPVDNSIISTEAEDGEKIFDTSFNTKKTYNLYNYTADPTEETYSTYDTVTRTSEIEGFARNPIFSIHTSLMRFIPLVVANMHPPLYAEARDNLLDMTRANYFYIISYPTYAGYRIVHDPTFTAYYAATQSTLGEQKSPFAGLVALGIVAAVIIVITGIIITVRKRSKRTVAKTNFQ